MARLLALRVIDCVGVIPIPDSDCRVWLEMFQPFECPKAGTMARPDQQRSLEMVDTRKTAIVTGASRGIGAGLVEEFLERGYNVVAN